MTINGDKSIAAEHTYLLFSHVSHLEPTFPIAPKQSPLIPTLSMVQIGPMSGEGLMGIMSAVYAHSKHMDMDEVNFWSDITKVEFVVDEEEERWRRICIDGDIITVQKGAKINIRVCDGVMVEDRSVLVIKCRC